MNTEKKFFRVRLAEKCTVNTKMVNGITLTKQWQVKTGEIANFLKFPDVEAQRVVKQGSDFVPAEESTGKIEKGLNGSVTTAQPGASQAANRDVSAKGLADVPDFAGMTVEQLKNFLIANGVAQNELRSVTKPELIERAEFIWSQNK
jgi:hypothetical protein